MKVRGTILPVTDLRSRPAHMRVAVTATAATPPRHATLTRPARPRQASRKSPMAWPADYPGGQHPGVKGACGVAARALRAPMTPGHRPRDLAAIKAMGARPARPRTRHANQTRPSDNTTNQARNSKSLTGRFI